MKKILLALFLAMGFSATAQSNYLWTWGVAINDFYYNFNNYYGQNFQNPWPYGPLQPVPIITPPVSFVEIESGGSNATSGGIASDGSLWIWTRNGNMMNAPEPLRYGTENNWKTVAFTNSGRYAIKTDGSLWNILGNLAVQIGTDTNWVSIRGGTDHMLGLKSNGTLWRWSNNSAGTITRMPIQLGTDANWQKIDAVQSNSGAIKTDGSIWFWGDEQRDTIPQRMGTENNWRDLTVVSGGVIAIKANGTLWARGTTNNSGQLGIGSTSPATDFTQIGTATDWHKIAGGEAHVMALKNDQSLWAWGANSNAQLGDSSEVNRLVPTQIGTAKNWLQIAAGSNHSVAVRSFGFSVPTSSSVAENGILPLTIYPNPANRLVRWRINDYLTDARFEIRSLNGQLLAAGPLSGNEGTFDLADLPAGIYLVSIQTGKQLYFQRLVRQ